MEEVLLFLMGERGAPTHLRKKNKCGTYIYTLTVDKKTHCNNKMILIFKPRMFKYRFK
jgi:hypothetical protein